MAGVCYMIPSEDAEGRAIEGTEIMDMFSTVFMLDVDNTLLDNDRLKADLDAEIEALVGDVAAKEFWRTYEEVRTDENVVDYPATLERFRSDHPNLPNDRLQALIVDVPFDRYLYPGALTAVDHLKTIGTPIVVSDGDPVYQRMKIDRSGIAARVDGQVVLTTHKEAQLPDVFRRFPADHYVMIDDKASILAGIQSEYPPVITVLLCQGKYARLRATPKPDMVVPHIGDVAGIPLEEFLDAEPDSERQSASRLSHSTA